MNKLSHCRWRETRYYWLRQHTRRSKPGSAAQELLAHLRYTP